VVGARGHDHHPATSISRGRVLPKGTDPVDTAADTVLSLAERTTRYFLEDVDRHGVAALPSTVALLLELRRRRIRTAVVSSSCEAAQRLGSALTGARS
jgi:beta-phosphoglucomutase-like phosphatase (HAD superfamily)